MTPAWEVVSVIVCYHDAPAVECLCRLLACESVERHATIVIDHSSDAYRATCAPEYAAIANCCAALILEPGNRGSAGGFRRGQEWALERGASFVWLHDQDGAPIAGCLDVLLAVLRTDGKVAAAAPVVEDESGLPQREFCGQRGLLGLPRFVEPPAKGRTASVAFVASAGLLLRSTTLRKVGTYDDVHYFVGYEDFDFCARLAQAGEGIVACGSARYRHPHLLRKRGHPWPPDPGLWRTWGGAAVRYLGLVNLRMLLERNGQSASPNALRSFRYFALKHAGPLAWHACLWSSFVRTNADGRASLRLALGRLDAKSDERCDHE
jgi:GT2 family glycosyltransferase